MLNSNQFKKILKKMLGADYPSGTGFDYTVYSEFKKAKEMLEKMPYSKCNTFKFVDCPTPPASKAQPAVCDYCLHGDPCVECKQEGKTPMRYNDNYACASVTAPQSDTAVTRDYLLQRLAKTFAPKERELTATFNLYVDNSPKTYKEMIDAIKNDKFKIDPKVERRLADAEEDEDDFCYVGPLFGIIWDGPQPDRKGYEAAAKEMAKQHNAAKDAIMVKSADDGLAAIQAFEAWLPTTPAN